MINFDQKFDKNNFLKFLDFFLPDDFKKSDEEYKLAETDDLFERANLLGIVKSLNNLPVFEIIRIKPENSRVKITKRLFKFLEIHGFSHALILTHSVHETHYRFSLITSKLIGLQKKVEKKFSDPKDYLFLVITLVLHSNKKFNQSRKSKKF